MKRKSLLLVAITFVLMTFSLFFVKFILAADQPPAAPSSPISILQIIGLIAPLAVTYLVQGLKKLTGANGWVSMAVVFIIAGTTAIIGVGPSGGSGIIDTTVNAGWIIGLATLIYEKFFKKAAIGSK